VHRSLAERYDVSGFPTLKIFPAGDADAPAATVFLDNADGGVGSPGLGSSGSLSGDGVREGGDALLERLVRLVNGRAGTARTATGGLLPGTGRCKACDAALAARPLLFALLAHSSASEEGAGVAGAGAVNAGVGGSAGDPALLVSARSTALAAALDELRGLASTAMGAELYARTLELWAARGGRAWAKGEAARLARLAGDAGIAGQKRTVLLTRLDVVSALLEADELHAEARRQGQREASDGSEGEGSEEVRGGEEGDAGEGDGAGEVALPRAELGEAGDAHGHDGDSGSAIPEGLTEEAREAAEASQEAGAGAEL